MREFTVYKDGKVIGTMIAESSSEVTKKYKDFSLITSKKVKEETIKVESACKGGVCPKKVVKKTKKTTKKKKTTK